MNKPVPDVPICQKINLTLSEAAAYSGIGVNRLRTLSKTDGKSFVLHCGNKMLFKREAFERYLSQAHAV